MTLLALLLSLFSPGSDVSVVDIPTLKKHTLIVNDTLYVVNFWATWCKPCIEEMPCFENAAKEFSNKKVKVVFVSTNSLKEKASVEKMVNDKGISSEVLLLNAGNPNVWINEIEPNWSGSLPATILYRNGKKVLFHEGEMNQTQLDSVIHLNIN